MVRIECNFIRQTAAYKLNKLTSLALMQDASAVTLDKNHTHNDPNLNHFGTYVIADTLKYRISGGNGL